MAFTLAQRHNLANGLAIDDAAGSLFVNKIYSSVRLAGQNYLDGQLLLSDASLSAYNLTDAQMVEFSFRALRGYMDQYIVPMVLDKNNLPANPDTATDAQINLGVRRSIGPFAKRIGNGF